MVVIVCYQEHDMPSSIELYMPAIACVVSHLWAISCI